MSQYPEHDKLQLVHEISQAQGDLLEWLAEQGVHLMRFEKWDEPTEEECPRCSHASEAAKARCQCENCNGTHRYTVNRHYERWVDDFRSIPTILAEYHGIDPQKLEREKRAMLADLAQQGSGVSDG